MPISPSLALVPPRGDCRRSRIVGGRAAGIGLLLCVAFSWGCAKQAEGDRCDLNNGDLDCDTGLLCRGEADLSLRGTGKGIALCCPISSVDIKVEACRAGVPFLDPAPEEPPVTVLPDAGQTTTPAPVVDAGALQPDATPAP